MLCEKTCLAVGVDLLWRMDKLWQVVVVMRMMYDVERLDMDLSKAENLLIEGRKMQVCVGQ